MHRRPLLQELRNHQPFDVAEERSLRKTIEFVSRYPDCFERSLGHGHVTGSAWVVNSTSDRVLLTHHRKLRMWVQLGGHADGESDILQVALREAREESGIEEIVPVHHNIFDVDVHPIPAAGTESRHDHYDIRFLLRVIRETPLRVSHESLDLKWFSATALAELDVDASVRRMARRWRTLFDGGKTVCSNDQPYEGD